MRRCEYFVGTSAGSIVAAHLVAGRIAAPPADRSRTLAPRRSAPPSPRQARRAARVARRVTGEWALARGVHIRTARRSGSPRPGAPSRGQRCCDARPAPTETLDGLRKHVARLGRPLRRAAPRRPRSTAAPARRIVFGSPGRAVRDRRRCGGRLLQRPVALCPGRDRRPRVRRRRRLERHQHGRGARRTRGSLVLCLNPTAQPSNDGHRVVCSAGSHARPRRSRHSRPAPGRDGLHLWPERDGRPRDGRQPNGPKQGRAPCLPPAIDRDSRSPPTARAA